MPGALDDITVLEIANWVAGPFFVALTSATDVSATKNET